MQLAYALRIEDGALLEQERRWRRLNLDQGLAGRRRHRVILARNLLGTLQDRELASVGKALQDQTGHAYRPLRDGKRTSGIYRRSIQLNSGRYALPDDG